MYLELSELFYVVYLAVNIQVVYHLYGIQWTALKHFKQGQVSSANAENEPPYKSPSPYFQAYGCESDDNLKVGCGSSRILRYWEL